MDIHITLTLGNILLIIAHSIWLVAGVAVFAGATSGGGDAGLIGFMMWAGGMLFFLLMIWLTYFAIVGIQYTFFMPH